jgi:hypothetical protein
MRRTSGHNGHIRSENRNALRKERENRARASMRSDSGPKRRGGKKKARKSV